MNALQAALKSGQMTMEDVQLKLGIICRSHKQYPNLVSFKYDILNSPMSDPIVQSARGIVLNINDWSIVSWPFEKFWNHGEPLAAQIDWDTARVQEKLDGSLIHMYHYDGKWQVASSGSPDAGGSVGDLGMTFAELFWQTWNSLGCELPARDILKKCTFMFELMTPFNRIVVDNKVPRIVLIGVRDNITGAELSLDRFRNVDVEVVKEFSLGSMDEIVNSFKRFKGIDQEGYIVVDASYNRVKIKHPEYVALHHLKGDTGPTLKRMLNIICTGEASEVIAHFPDWKDEYNKAYSRFDRLLADLETQYAEALASTTTQKEFVVYALKSRCADALFKRRSGKIKTFFEYFKGLSIDRTLKIVEKT